MDWFTSGIPPFSSSLLSDLTSTISLQLESMRHQAEQAVQSQINSSTTSLSSLSSSFSSFVSNFLFSPFSSRQDIIAQQQAAVEAAIWQDVLSTVRSLSCILWREQIDIYLTNLPPGPHVDLIRYYGQMQLYPRAHLLVCVASVGVIPLLRLIYSNRFPSSDSSSSADVRKQLLPLPYRLCIYGGLFICLSVVLVEALPVLFWPLIHRSLFIYGKMTQLLQTAIFGHGSCGTASGAGVSGRRW
eukprot:GHVS01057074.1.p1 GENE.GHVS01057074.1~~GHVS01057074.1.p1  ORF type:complete len:243 (+),score=49.27 GHVS01057074.1:230-958(+)